MGSPLTRFIEFSFWKSYEWHSSWSNFAIISKLLRPFIACSRNRLAGADATEIIDHFNHLGNIPFASLFQEIEYRPGSHPYFGRPATCRPHRVVGVELGPVS